MCPFCDSVAGTGVTSLLGHHLQPPKSASPAEHHPSRWSGLPSLPLQAPAEQIPPPAEQSRAQAAPDGAERGIPAAGTDVCAEQDLHHDLRHFVPPFLTTKISPALGKADDFHPPWSIWQKAAPVFGPWVLYRRFWRVNPAAGEDGEVGQAAFLEFWGLLILDL